MTSKIEIDFNAGRICEAIAKIGYEPHTAIMDIIDNSVTAGANDISVNLILAEGKNLKSRNAVSTYVITDNGCGMDTDGIKNAFSLGSNNNNYTLNSLSKYGLGLKSAGLSLGTSITIISKINNIIYGPFTFDSDAIKKQNILFINKTKISDFTSILPNSFNNSPSGTVVLVQGCGRINQASPKLTTEKLKKRLGVTYFSFLKRDNPLKITLNIKPYGQTGTEIPIQPRDMLFMDSPDFKERYIPDAYDYYSPILAMKDKWTLQDVNGNDLPVIEIKAVVFPQASMAESKSPLPQELKEKISSYEISKENSGFFIYRNGRLIRWGDDIDGIITKDDINVRIRMDLETAHDDVLHVDITKQRLEIDDETRNKLKAIVDKALITAENIRSDCKFKLKSTKNEEGLGFTATIENVSEDDPDLITGQLNSEIIKRRNESAVDGENAKQDLDIKINDSSTHSFRKIVYSEKVDYGMVWKAFYDATEGVFVGVNKNHPFYKEFLSKFPENSTERIVSEALIFSVGLAERNTRDNFVEVDVEIFNKIFKKFHNNINNWLAEWSGENINLAE
ncbi:hypothetical protein FDW96_00885 [Citrobacter sp. TBCS-15]|uniref:ATP-binding protein n=1 Tax=Citrobacter sp. TBCS-15 TaxID=2576407 RepID=UPI0010C940DB|nr:ATP-binding protein [Citrobacter sp. TBCS-15]TKU13801.1 hypothetical protein FDW96_00885 [Citrobacter sp. TBCS-15]